MRLILARLDSIDSRLDSVESRLSTLEDKVDRGLQETRPTWEQVLVRLDPVEGQLVSFGGRRDGFEGKLVSFEGRLDDFGGELRSSLRRFGRQVEVPAKDVFEVRTGQRDLDWRMDKTEDSKAT